MDLFKILHACFGYVHNLNLDCCKMYLEFHGHKATADKMTPEMMAKIHNLLTRLNNDLCEL